MEVSEKLPMSFWVIAGVGLLWNIIGLVMYFLQMTASADALSATYTDEQVAYLLSIPTWANAAFGLAVIAGVLGCVALLLRKGAAKILFMLSLAGIIVQNIYNFGIGGSLEVFGTAAIPLPVMVILIAIGLLVYSRSASRDGLID